MFSIVKHRAVVLVTITCRNTAPSSALLSGRAENWADCDEAGFLELQIQESSRLSRSSRNLFFKPKLLQGMALGVVHSCLKYAILHYRDASEHADE